MSIDDEDDDYELMSDDTMEMISYSFDDFVTGLLEARTEEFNVLDVSAIVLSRLCRYSIEAGYSDSFQELLTTAHSSLDKYDTDDIFGNRTLQ